VFVVAGEGGLRGLAGGDKHGAAPGISEHFGGKCPGPQHQLVNAAFGTDMGTTLHSLSVQTKAPD
jgi:stress-induced morphogen